MHICNRRLFLFEKIILVLPFYSFGADVKWTNINACYRMETKYHASDWILWSSVMLQTKYYKASIIVLRNEKILTKLKRTLRSLCCFPKQSSKQNVCLFPWHLWFDMLSLERMKNERCDKNVYLGKAQQDRHLQWNTWGEKHGTRLSRLVFVWNVGCISRK